MRSSSSAACAATASAAPRAHGSISPAYCEPISWPGEIPLVEQEQRLPARLAPRERHAGTARSSSSVEVE